MAIISRGFRGKRETDPRIPPGQYLERGFPVLSAGPTPRADLSTWTFSITADGAALKTWTWSELTHLPHDDIVKDIHCVTKWSKLDSVWRGISLDTLLDAVEIDPEHAVRHGALRRRLHHERAARGPARRQGVDRLPVRRRARCRPSTAARPGC